MRQLLIDKPEGLGFYPVVSSSIGGGISCVSEAPPFWIENLSNSTCTVTLAKYGSPDIVSLGYSSDQSTWETFTTDGTGSFEIPAKSKAYVKGGTSTFSSSSSNYYTFSFNQQCNIGGNLMSLVRGSNTVTEYMFYYLFNRNANLVNASQLLLPATTLASYCYKWMFSGCTSLTTAPALLATTLASYCYQWMFSGCTSLTTVPVLPATTLAEYCYYGMFQGCTSLTTAPVLPATELANCCYNSMFNGCKALITAPALPATTLATKCYAGMFWNCTKLTNAPALLATVLANYCYNAMFMGCTALTTAPQMYYGNLMEQDYCEGIFFNTNITSEGYPSHYFSEPS